MSTTLVGLVDWGGGRSEDMHRQYYAKFLVESTSKDDGPQTILATSGLPLVGSGWIYGNDSDSWAICHPGVQCESVVKNEPNFWWILTYNFATRPWRFATGDSVITNPQSIPDMISGSFVTYQKRTQRDINGVAIASSSLEPIWVNKDVGMATVEIQQTRLNLQLPTLTQMYNTVNDRDLWGLPSHCVKLRSITWRRLVWGVRTFYYERVLGFDIKFNTFYEDEIADVGTRVVNKQLAGYVARPNDATVPSDLVLDRTNPQVFVRNTDETGNVLRQVLLDGYGEECTDPLTHVHVVARKQMYTQSNFLLLGIPTVI
jgi:hypothetical protein